MNRLQRIRSSADPTPSGATVVLGAVLAVVLAVLGVSWAVASSAAPSRPLHTGLGYRLPGGDFVGYYVTAQGTKVYCIDPGRAAPSTVALGAVRGYPGVAHRVLTELGYSLSTWGDARSRSQAAVESQVVNTLVGNGHDVHRRARAIPARLRAVVSAHVRQARAMAGPYTVRVSLGHAVLPGQSSSGSVLVRAANGTPVPGVRLRMTHSGNATVAGRLRTDRAGRVHFTWTPTGVGTVRIGAVARSLPAAGLRGTHPPRGVQRMIGWTRPATASGAATSTRSPVGFTAAYSCSSTCDGHPRTTLRACAPGSRYASRMRYQAGSRVLFVRFPAAAGRRCVSRSLRLADGDRVTARWQYRTPRGWSSAVAAPGGLRIDCPAVPAVHADVAVACSAALVHLELARPTTGNSWAPLVNTTAHRMVLVVGGSVSKRIYADHGQGAGFSVDVPCTRSETLTARAGVQRANGAYNYGPTLTFSTPGRGATASG